MHFKPFSSFFVAWGGFQGFYLSTALKHVLLRTILGESYFVPTSKPLALLCSRTSQLALGNCFVRYCSYCRARRLSYCSMFVYCLILQFEHV